MGDLTMTQAGKVLALSYLSHTCIRLIKWISLQVKISLFPLRVVHADIISYLYRRFKHISAISAAHGPWPSPTTMSSIWPLTSTMIWSSTRTTDFGRTKICSVSPSWCASIRQRATILIHRKRNFVTGWRRPFRHMNFESLFLPNYKQYQNQY